MKKLNKVFIFSFVLLAITPSLALASWWNPVSWFDFIFHPTNNIEVVQKLTPILNTQSATSTSQTQVASSTNSTSQQNVTPPIKNKPVIKQVSNVVTSSDPTPVLASAPTPSVTPVAIPLCPNGMTLASNCVTEPNSSQVSQSLQLPPATSAQITSLMSLCTSAGLDCTATLNGYNTNAIFRSNMDSMIQQWQAKQQQTTPISCDISYKAENTKVLDDFLTVHSEYQPANDPNDVKWNLFKSIFESYNVKGICPQQLKSLLEKTDTQLKATNPSYQSNVNPTSGTNSTNPLNFLYNMVSNSDKASVEAGKIVEPGVYSIQAQEQQRKQQQQIQQIQSSLDQMKQQQEAQRQQQQFQQQLLQMRPNCNQVSLYDRLSLSGGCNN
jgi:hypothetical protein